MLARILVVVFALTLAFPLAESTQLVEAKKKFKTKTVTRTFSNAGAIAIPGTGTAGNANPFPSTLDVAGFKKGKITKVVVKLNDFTHTFPDDVNVLLVAPNGKPVFIIQDAGGSDDVANLNFVFDDDATAVIPDEAPATSGTFRPSVYDLPSGTTAPYRFLSAFAGTNPNGTWQLFVYDDFAPDAGQFAGGWSLDITAKTKVKAKKKK